MPQKPGSRLINHLAPIQTLPTYIGEINATNIYLKEMHLFFNAFVNVQFLECL